MIKNIINENLDQFGLPYGEGQRITPQNFVPTMPMRDPNYGIPSAARDQVAELFNYNTLPQASEKFEPNFGGMLDATRNLGKNYKGTTRGDFMKALQDGTLGVGSSQLFDKNVDDLFEGVNLDERGFGFGNVSPTFKGTTDGSFRGNIDIDKGALSDDALQSLPKGFFQNVGDQSSLIGPGGYPMTAMAIDPNRMTDAYSGFFNTNPTTNRNFDRDFSQLPSYGDAISRTNVQGMDYEMDPAAQEGFLNPNIQPSQNMFQRAGNFVKDLELEEYLPFMGERSLTGMLGRGIGNLFQNIAPARYGTSQRAYNALSPQGRSAVGGIYGPRGIMSGYNAVSAFGRGPVGAINNRISNIQNRKAAQTDASRETIKDLYEARNRAAGVSMEGRTYTGFGKTGMGRDPNDVTGGAGPSGGSSKIVCTMMNESYGFGNFRNKIWLKHSKDLPKEYEAGYHKIFLPLVKFAKEEGKLNKVVKKTLEHIARHRTLDLKQEMKGKTHTLGRVYRKILEPICFLVGKASMFVRRG